MARLLAWNGLSEGVERGKVPERQSPDDLTEFEGRQQRGELAAELDPGIVVLALFGAVLSPTVLPDIARRMTGLPSDDPEFQRRFIGQLKLIVRRLAEQHQ